MNKTVARIVLSTLCLSAAAFAGQSAAPSGKAKDTPLLADAERYKTAISNSRRNLFEQAMQGLTPEAREKFWAIYADYESEKNQIAAARVAMLKRYSDLFGSENGLSDADVTETIHGLARLQNEVTDLRVKYFDIISARIDVKTAGHFALVDDYVTAAIRMQWLNQIPFPGDPK